MKTLITGASGFLGTALCAELNKTEDEITILNSKNCDLTRHDTLNQFSHISFDRIIHLAAWTQAGDFCLKHPGEQWVINQKINTHILSWWQEKQSKAKFIAMGTSCAYDPSMELIEDNYMKGIPIDSLFTYAQTKRMLYAGLLAFKKQFNAKYLCLIPSTLYGPGYHTDGRQMHFIFDLIRKILEFKYKGTPIVLWGNGDQKRELVFIDDFVKIMLKLSSLYDNSIFNIGAGEEYSIRQFAQIICDITGVNSNVIIYDTNKYTGAKSKCLNIDKLKNTSIDISMTPLKIGLRKTIKWFENYFFQS